MQFDDHVARARALLDRFVAGALPTDSEVAQLAAKRMQRALAPARRGKDSFKDCVVVESYLAATRALRDAGLNAPIVFASSNIKDFTDNGTLRPELAQEFAAIDLVYAPNFSAAAHRLGLAN